MDRSKLGVPRPTDIRIAVIVAVIQIAGTLGAYHHGAHGQRGCWWASSCRVPKPLDALAFVLLALGPLALVVRRAYPRAVLLAVFALTLVYVALGYLQGPGYASLVVAFVATAVSGHRVAAAATLGAGWVLFLWVPAALGITGAPTVLALFAIAAWLLLLFTGAEALRARKLRVVEARRAREREARRRADEERLQIARELHDVLAHNISLINVQSGVALHLIDQQPEQARIALSAINDASADALREVRSVLGLLRGTGEEPPRTPPAGMARLDELVSRAASAGIDVSLVRHGRPRTLPTSVDLAAFRIVQESLTNVVRHASARAARVQISYLDGELKLQIDDDGRGEGAPTTRGGGHGIAGMRERAVALGGELAAGPGPDGGFRVRARLPVDGAR